MSEGYNGIEPSCPECGSDMDWEDCPNCCDGYIGHDCGEDSCCCLDPEDNVICEICGGSVGWWICNCCRSDSERREAVDGRSQENHI